MATAVSNNTAVAGDADCFLDRFNIIAEKSPASIGGEMNRRRKNMQIATEAAFRHDFL